jgi:hypothetical protein
MPLRRYSTAGDANKSINYLGIVYEQMAALTIQSCFLTLISECNSYDWQLPYYM